MVPCGGPYATEPAFGHGPALEPEPESGKPVPRVPVPQAKMAPESVSDSATWPGCWEVVADQKSGVTASGPAHAAAAMAGRPSAAAAGSAAAKLEVEQEQLAHDSAVTIVAVEKPVEGLGLLEYH